MRRLIINTLKRILGTTNLSLFVKRQKRKYQKCVYKRKFGIEEISKMLIDIGIEKGSTLFIHSAWDEFYNFNGSPEDFINEVLKIIGEDGTLAMPCFPLLRKKTSIFKVKSTPTGAGILAEAFRTYEGVCRSVNIRHSVAAIGRNAKYLTEGHINSITVWDENSPYYRLRNIDAKVLTIGLDKYFTGTILHCQRSILREESEYYGKFFGKEIHYQYKDIDDIIKEDEYLSEPDKLKVYYLNSRRKRYLLKYFNQQYFKRKNISNLLFCICDAKYVIDRSIELGRNGISFYASPRPPKY